MSIEWVLILTVKMETEHPVGGSFGSEFPAICDHCVVMVGWSRKRLKFLWEIFVFFWKTTPHGKIFTILFRKFSSHHRSTLLCSNFVKFGRREMGEIVRYLPDKIFVCISNCRYCADRAQNVPGPTSNNVLRVLQISSKSVHFRRSYSRTREHCRKVNPIFGRSVASSRITSVGYMDILVADAFES